MKTLSKNDYRNSDEFRKKIHHLIPGGAHTYSKGDDQFPSISPAAISHGKGAYVWDIDGNKFLDCSMGLSSVCLGHAFEPVISRVKAELDKGVNFQRPSVLELEMAETFLSLLPGHDMIKFAKNGSIVTTAAVKLARAYTNRKYVAFPSDHSFYSYDDWFIAKTESNRGIPEEISQLSLTYVSTDLSTLEDLFRKYPGQIACIITEPIRFTGNPTESYLSDLQKLCRREGAVLIFDEMVSGFKVDFPGAFSKFGVVPDLATWGKGISNGFSFCALTGKKEIMDLGGIRKEGEDKLFLISTTHGGETHSMAACLATIEVFKKENVIEHNHRMGKRLCAGVKRLIEKHELSDNINLFDTPWMPVFVFRDSQKQVSASYRTLFLQEMIARGVLFQGIFIPC